MNSPRSHMAVAVLWAMPRARAAWPVVMLSSRFINSLLMTNVKYEHRVGE